MDGSRELASNMQAVRKRIAAACDQAGRSPASVTLLLATKTVPAERLAVAGRSGHLLFGENRVQEARAKASALRDTEPAVAAAAEWHMIGHLQTNKVKHALQLFSCVQSVDRPRLVDKLEHRLTELQRTLEVYIQVNTSGETSKYGVAPAEAPALVDHVQRSPHLELRGLMTLGRLGVTPEAARPGFAALRELRDRLRAAGELGRDQVDLSMGMSGDFEVAVEEGATLVRVGSAVFGQRSTPDSAYWPETR